MKLAYAVLIFATPLLAQDAPPDAAAQRGLIQRLERNALDAQNRLPDFVCTQLTTRSEDISGRGNRWKKRDTLEVEFTFVDRKPHWKLVKINNKKTRKQYDDLNKGFISDELLQFFSLPGGLFGQDAGTIFQWERWDEVDGRRVAVYSLRVPASASKLALSNAWSHLVIGFHGFLYADPEAAQVLRLEVSLDVPRHISVQASDVTVDYRPVPIGSQEFLLPVHATVRLLDEAGLAKNEIDVEKYQKYSADSTITFGDQ